MCVCARVCRVIVWPVGFYTCRWVFSNWGETLCFSCLVVCVQWIFYLLIWAILAIRHLQRKGSWCESLFCGVFVQPSNPTGYWVLSATTREWCENENNCNDHAVFLTISYIIIYFRFPVFLISHQWAIPRRKRLIAGMAHSDPGTVVFWLYVSRHPSNFFCRLNESSISWCMWH